MHQSYSSSEGCLVCPLFSVYQQALFTHTSADMASCVALGYQIIKERVYNGEGLLEEKATERQRIEEKRRGNTVAAMGVLFPPLSLTYSPYCLPPDQGITQASGRSSSGRLHTVTKAATTLSCSSATQAALSSTPLLMLG